MAEESNTFEAGQIRRRLPTLPWNSLPESYKLGDNYNDVVTLYRGDKIDKFSGDIKPNATDEEIYEFLDILQKETAKSNSPNLGVIINSHLTYAHRDGVHTPFISASASLKFAERFIAKSEGVAKGIATLKVPVNRLIAIRSFPDDKLPLEVLILGGVLHEEIANVKAYDSITH